LLHVEKVNILGAHRVLHTLLPTNTNHATIVLNLTVYC
jgi:hypothetical protein